MNPMQIIPPEIASAGAFWIYVDALMNLLFKGLGFLVLVGLIIVIIVGIYQEYKEYKGSK